MKKFMSLALAAAFIAGVQGVALASTPQMVMLDEEVILEVDEPVESGDILVDENGDEWEVQSETFQVSRSEKVSTRPYMGAGAVAVCKQKYRGRGTA